METGKAIYKLLKDSSAVGAICADRIFPEMAQQDAVLPFIVYTVTDTTPAATKNATSKLDTARVELYCVSDDYEVGMNLGIAVRGALDRQSGTLSGVEVQSIDFDTSDVQFDSDQRVYVLEQTYDVRIQRTGTAVSVAQFPSNSFTVEEVDGTPSGAVTKLVFSNNTVTINGSTATIQSGGGGSLTVQETSAADSATATTLEFPANSVTHAASKATISLLQGLAAEFAGDAGASAIFANGLVGDINQDGTVSTTDLLALLGNFGNTASPTSGQLTQALSRAQEQMSNGDNAFFSNSRVSSAQASVTALTNAGHVVEYFEGINSVQGRGFISNYLADTVADNTVRRTMYISGTPFPTALSQMQAYPLGPYDDTAQSTIQTVVDAYINSITANGSVVILRTLISSTPDKLLDTYTGAAAAYSVRKLDKDYSGSCMRIRRDSDDSETDIGFDSSGDMDTSAIATHCGSANGFVVTWYDQSGNTNNATQSTGGSQPQIYNGSAVITENGKPAIDFDGSADTLEIADFAYSTSALSFYNVLKLDSTSDNMFFSHYNTSGAQRAWTIRVQATSMGYTLSSNGSNYFIAKSETLTTNQYLWTLLYKGSESGFDRTKGFVNGSARTFVKHFSNDSSNDPPSSLHNSTSNLNIGSYAGAGFMNCKAQEVILYPSDQSSNRSGIEGNINAHFQIGNFGTPTSGLLSTYTGAAAAYSVRQLANTAALCMRVRRDNDDAEQDFGFDANGDLDTAAIATFVGSGNNGYVSKWYDQSGNGKDAEQTTNATQPQIYNGSAVITEGSKPALDHDGSRWMTLGISDLSNTNLFAEASDPFAVMCVAKYDDTSAPGGGTIFSKAMSVGSGRTLQIAHVSNGISTRFRGSETLITTPADLHILQEAHWSGSAALAVLNGTETSATVGTYSENSENINIGSRTDGGFIIKGKIQEIIVWGNAQDSTNRTAIRTSMNDYFSIY